jgi:hypothetical protein
MPEESMNTRSSPVMLATWEQLSFALYLVKDLTGEQLSRLQAKHLPHSGADDRKFSGQPTPPLGHPQ